MIAFTPFINTHDVAPILSQIAIFGGATQFQLGEIFARLEEGVVQKGEHVFRKGDDPSHIYIIKSGIIELLIPGEDVTILKKRLKTGDCFGHAALMGLQPHAVSAVASEDSEIIVLSKRAMHQLRHEDIELFALLTLNIGRELARRLKYTDEMLVDFMVLIRSHRH
jgi:CRP/FNR family cyclic AMP-dependent transcriptional regulator